MKKYVAIVLSGGSGKRMNSQVHKQYLLIKEKPVIYYALKAFQESNVDEIVLVVGSGEIDFARDEIEKKYCLSKFTKIVEGCKERYHSVYEGLKAAEDADYVLIHDGARPFVNQDIILRSMEAVKEYGACVAGMPVKDTIKIADESGYAAETPERSKVWMVQTPQTFSYELIRDAYCRMLQNENTSITDDAMVVETMTDTRVKLVEGDYRNIKITTPEDLLIAEALSVDNKELEI